VYTGEEPLRIKAWQGESLNLCHGSKGPWLKVSSGFTCSAQVLSFITSRREDTQDKRSRRAWIRDEVETEALNATLVQFKYYQASRLVLLHHISSGLS
jgi:hypothetical protein